MWMRNILPGIDTDRRKFCAKPCLFRSHGAIWNKDRNFKVDITTECTSKY